LIQHYRQRSMGHALCIDVGCHRHSSLVLRPVAPLFYQRSHARTGFTKSTAIAFGMAAWGVVAVPPDPLLVIGLLMSTPARMDHQRSRHADFLS
jgi:hypothetical protein